MAKILLTVSIKVSPFLTELFPEEKLITSADNLFSASSKDRRGRGEFSKKMLAIVISLREGTFLIGRLITSLKLCAGSKISCISSSLMFFIPNERRVLSCCSFASTHCCNRHCILFQSFSLPRATHIWALKCVDLASSIVRLDREVTRVFTVDQYHQLYLFRSSKGNHSIQCRTDRSSFV